MRIYRGGMVFGLPPLERVLTTSNRYSVNGIPVDIPSPGIFRVVGGGLALGLCFIERSSEY
jgi:hypothetical protein